ncbi:hypothetical protein J32TS6_25520 [Virgibacillus pantothenticus]|uniref:Uncharacterized protein n=1 Tax=Virgibacillus pantothenticus TaxID=1473 RepID=A0A0L0QRK3_VIRPA|nr:MULTISPECIES: hypothetical protein [Virgibacillus]API92123.1 hypothetical protein BKP57_09925 [Virgibacillus sp. 6R]KNE21265.1 hypothetical protein AFK71_06205 [Virgibacillus pantothenticus]MBS7430592.1 hypothetical protein [Virgibacillus sp. 19R1-5]MED3737030.1 hypothetical protein [Virgibacillus pantothenticus]QTY16315.1 hypothetical protein KBP50_21345 [Virgibacillus pantothenticus]
MNINSTGNSIISWHQTERNTKSLYLKDKDNNDSKLEVVTINGRIRKYIVLRNGKKILISEEKISKESLQKDSTLKQKQQSNTAETIEYLNHLMGVSSSNTRLQIFNMDGGEKNNKEKR